VARHIPRYSVSHQVLAEFQWQHWRFCHEAHSNFALFHDNIFYKCFTVSSSALGLTQPSTHWVPGALSLGVKWRDREVDNSPPSSAEDKECVELYFHSPIHIRGVLLSWRTGTNLSLTFTFRKKFQGSQIWKTKGAGNCFPFSYSTEAGVAQWYITGLQGWIIVVGVPARAGNFSPHHRVQDGSGAPPASYPMDARGSFPWGKAAGAWRWPLITF
jgi:hypothetical protein